MKSVLQRAAAFCLALMWLAAGTAEERPEVVTASKLFTESVILGELLAALAEAGGAEAQHEDQLGGTQIVWQALLRGDVDAYVDYTGTLMEETLAQENISTVEELRTKLAELGLKMSDPIGFNNTYAFGMLRARAEELGVKTVSDLRDHPELTFGFSHEFIDRDDGWIPLKTEYGLPQTDVSGLEHELAYAALDSGKIDLTELYSTDAKIQRYDLAVLEDDRSFFPEYYAVVVYRADLAERAPKVEEMFLKLNGAVSEAQMVAMNARVEIEKVDETRAAADFLAESFPNLRENQPIELVDIEEENWKTRLKKHTKEHLLLVAIPLIAAIAVSIPIGIGAARNALFAQTSLGAVGILQTIPSLALLVFMIPLVGIGKAAAMLALFFYSLLPIVRNTHAGLASIPKGIDESAKALGLTSSARLWLVELPIALRSILAGVKIASVQLIGFATLGAFVGAGGYGQPILTGLRVSNNMRILEGAVPAALMALAAQGVFGLIERGLVSKGLRIRSET